jgi:hypothetical protein
MDLKIDTLSIQNPHFVVRRRLYLRPSLNAPDQSPTCQFNDPDQCLSGEYSGKSFNYQERLSGSRDAGLIGNGWRRSGACKTGAPYTQSRQRPGLGCQCFWRARLGKSRLFAELRQREVISRVSFIEDRSISIGKNLSFHPVIALFKQWARIMEDDAQTEASNRLETAISRVCGDETNDRLLSINSLKNQEDIMK